MAERSADAVREWGQGRVTGEHVVVGFKRESQLFSPKKVIDIVVSSFLELVAT